MIRHVKEIKATIDNLTVLRVSSVDVDKKQLRESVAESIGRLEQQILIHKSQDEYLFLTNEEQAINKEIKNIDSVCGTTVFQSRYPRSFTASPPKVSSPLPRGVCPHNFHVIPYVKRTSGCQKTSRSRAIICSIFVPSGWCPRSTST